MLVLLDANAVIAAPFDRPLWTILCHGAADWGITVLIPWVSLLESIGERQRAVDTDIAAVERLADKYPAAAETLHRSAEELRAARATIEDRFVAQAAELGVELIDPVTVPLEMARRQVERRKPCKASGDGLGDFLAQEHHRDDPQPDAVIPTPAPASEPTDEAT
ncbi:hypothetical protein GCM10022221_09910 [Actinocorallia aurea]